MATFKTFLKKHPKIRETYQGFTAKQKTEYKEAFESGGRSAAKTYMDSISGGGDDSGGITRDDAYIDNWLKNHPQIKRNFDGMSDEEQSTFYAVFKKSGRKKAVTFLNKVEGIVSADTATEEINGVTVPTPTLYPDAEDIDPVAPLEKPSYVKNEAGIISSATEDRVPGINQPKYDTTGAIEGGTLKRVDGVDAPDFEGADTIGEHTAAETDYTAIDPMQFAEKYGSFYRDEVLKNAKLADQIALEQLNTELEGLTDFASGAAALKREETSVDNAFNTAQRKAQVEAAVPGVVDDVEAQRERANAYAEGRLPDEMEDRMMELNVRSRSADASGAAGFGGESVAAQKASTLMSAEQRMGVAQYGEQLLTQNMQKREDLYLPPTQYSDAGKQLSVMPSQSASVLSASALTQLNELASVSATTAMGTKVQQEQFASNLVNDISKFNASIQQDREKFNANLTERQSEFDASMQVKVDTFNAELEANQNLSEAEIQQRTEEFNAQMATQQAQFKATQEQNVSAFNANLAVNQNQFNASIEQRTNEFNANMAVNENQFDASLGLRVGEFNTTMEFNREVANAGIHNTFALGAFDYAVTYKGLIAGLINKDKDTQLQLDLAYKELEIYQESLNVQIDLEREKLDFAKEEADRLREEREEANAAGGSEENGDGTGGTGVDVNAGDPGRDPPPDEEE